MRDDYKISGPELETMCDIARTVPGVMGERMLGGAKDALAQAEENVRFYHIKYNNGAATSTDVLEAISLQTKAQTNYYSADYELKRSYAKLIYSMGSDIAAIYKKTEK